MNHPDNELYDSACELLAAAQRLTRAARGDDVERALPATLGCLEATLGALGIAWTTLEGPAARRGADLGQLRRTLRDAEHAADAARTAMAGDARTPRPLGSDPVGSQHA